VRRSIGRKVDSQAIWMYPNDLPACIPRSLIAALFRIRACPGPRKALLLSYTSTRVCENADQFPTTRTWKLLSIGETFNGAGLPFVIGVFMPAPEMMLVR
jgi:hypothetical protein